MLPALGFTSDIISTFAQAADLRLQGDGRGHVAIWPRCSFVVWGHHMFVSGMSPYLGMAFAVGTMLDRGALRGEGLQLAGHPVARGSASRTRRCCGPSGSCRSSSAAASAASGSGSRAVDIPLHDTYFVVAHFHLIMAGAALFGVFGATTYWFPKMFGRMMNETLGKMHFWLTFPSVYVIFMPCTSWASRG